MRPRSSQSGVTLIELLIAVTLVALLATGMLLAIRVGMSAMQKSNARLMANRRAASVEKILEAEAGGIMPVKAHCAPSGLNAPLDVPFFQGDPQTMRFVTTYSLQQATRGAPMIVELQVIPGAENEGVRLVVNEHVYTGPFATGAFCAGMAPNETGAMMPVFFPVQTGPGSFVLEDKLAFCHFSYRYLAPAPNNAQTMLATWLPHWSKSLLPTAIAVDMAPLEPDSARVQPLALEIPIHVTKDPMKNDYVY